MPRPEPIQTWNLILSGTASTTMSGIPTADRGDQHSVHHGPHVIYVQSAQGSCATCDGCTTSRWVISSTSWRSSAPMSADLAPGCLFVIRRRPSHEGGLSAEHARHA